MTLIRHYVLWVLLLSPVSCFAQRGADNSKLAFWDTQRRGANCFNQTVTREWWTAAREAGFDFVRLAPNKWSTAERDFLLGSADRYDGLIMADLDRLREVLIDADSAGLKVVLTTLSLPGARWKQQNGDSLDLRVWQDTAFWRQSAQFWRDLASELQEYDCIVGYNVLNEPTPEQSLADVDASAALNGFYSVVVAAIRSVDATTPIIVGGGDWASAAGIQTLLPVNDGAVLYAVHMYEPYAYTNRKVNSGRYCYPGVMDSDSPDTLAINSSLVAALLAPMADWRERHGIAKNRIILEEFGCNRTVCGAERYLGDVIAVANGNEWHWAIYAFREDTWDGMDYELGTKPPKWEYWQAIERGEHPALPRVRNPIWEVIARALKGSANR